MVASPSIKTKISTLAAPVVPLASAMINSRIHRPSERSWSVLLRRASNRFRYVLIETLQLVENVFFYAVTTKDLPRAIRGSLSKIERYLDVDMLRPKSWVQPRTVERIIEDFLIMFAEKKRIINIQFL